MLVVGATHQPHCRVPPSLTCTPADQTRFRALCSARQRSLWRASFGMFPLQFVDLPQSLCCHRGADSMPTQRILVALFTKGRSNITQLAQHTSLSPRQLRNGLGVLIQQNLVYHSTDADSRGTSYEANSDASYNLVRSGKILEVIDSQYGTAERDLVQTLMLLGYARIADLTHAFTSRAPKTNGHTNGAHESGSGLIESEAHLNAALSRLIQAEIVETVRPDSFRNPAEVYREIEADVTKTGPGEKASKNKIEQHMQIVERFKAFRDQSKALKRQLDQSNGPVAKRRKLQNGAARADDPFADEVTQLNVRSSLCR